MQSVACDGLLEPSAMSLAFHARLEVLSAGFVSTNPETRFLVAKRGTNRRFRHDPATLASQAQQGLATHQSTSLGAAGERLPGVLRTWPARLCAAAAARRRYAMRDGRAETTGRLCPSWRTQAWAWQRLRPLWASRSRDRRRSIRQRRSSSLD